MTSDEIAKVVDAVGAFDPSMSAEIGTLRATLEVAYQLAILNDQIFGVLNSRIPQIRVMVEPGDWPIQTQEQRQ